MNKLTIRTIFAFIGLFLTVIGFAQSAKVELEKLLNNYQSQQEYHYRLNFAFYAEGKTKAIETMSGISLMKSGKKYYKIDNLESIISDALIVVVNSSEQYVILDKIENYEQYSGGDLQSILKNIETSGYELQFQESGANKRLILIAPGSASPVYEIFYNASYVINKIILNINSEDSEELLGTPTGASKMEISIESLPAAAPPKQVSSVVVKSSDSYQLTKTYQKFKFHNLLKK